MPPPPPLPVICDACKASGSAGGEGFATIRDILDFLPVPRRAQVNNWTPELQRAFIAALALTGSASRAGKAIGRHEHGAEKLRNAKGGKSFSDAWDAALGIYRDREMARLGEQMGDLSKASMEKVQKMDLKPGERGEDDETREVDEFQERFRGRLLNARRLYLLSIINDYPKRAAWEYLCGKVDWEKAALRQPQPNEPFAARRMVDTDMLVTVEGGCLFPMVGAGRDRGQELLDAIAEMQETQRFDGPASRRFFDDRPPPDEEPEA